MQDSLNLTKSIADVTAAALKGVIGAVQAIQADVVTAATPGVDPTAVQSDIAAKRAEIMSVIRSASFNGVNWLDNSQPYVIDENVTYSTTVDTDEATWKNFTSETTNDLSNNYQSGPYTTHQSVSDDVTVSNAGDEFFTYDYEQGPVDETHFKWVTNQSGYSGQILNFPPPAPTVSQGHIEASADQFPASASTTGVSYLSANVGSFNLLNSGIIVNRHVQGTTQYADQVSEFDAGTTTLSDASDVETAFVVYDRNTGNGTVLNAVSGPLNGLLTMDVSEASQAQLASYQITTASTLSEVEQVAAGVGALQNRVLMQQSFNSALSDALTSGIGSLVDADMNVASTRLQALRTQQQLGIQALSIANDNAAVILELFAS